MSTQYLGAQMPIVFLSHASEDNDLAKTLATSLYANGVKTFYDEWEIRSGESIRQKIDAGLEGCTHFVVLLSKDSITKPWVNAEIDGAFVRKLEGLCRFIPLRIALKPDELPPLLKCLHSPAIDNYEADLKSLVADLYEVSKAPILGSAPVYAQYNPLSGTHLSLAAQEITKLIIMKSENGLAGDPQLSPSELKTELNLPDDDIISGVDELQDFGYIDVLEVMGAQPYGFISIIPKERIFVEFDSLMKQWDPAKDAVSVAALIINNNEQNVGQFEKLLGWEPRRLNSAINYLIERNLVNSVNVMGYPYTTCSVFGTPKTRRFLKENS